MLRTIDKIVALRANKNKNNLQVIITPLLCALFEVQRNTFCGDCVDPSVRVFLPITQCQRLNLSGK
jgi:hypothetical protein